MIYWKSSQLCFIVLLIDVDWNIKNDCNSSSINTWIILTHIMVERAYMPKSEYFSSKEFSAYTLNTIT